VINRSTKPETDHRCRPASCRLESRTGQHERWPGQGEAPASRRRLTFAPKYLCRALSWQVMIALRVHAQAMRRGEDETAQPRALVEGGVMANRTKSRSRHTSSGGPLNTKNTVICRVFSQCPRQESNLDPPLRRRLSYPLDYEGVTRPSTGQGPFEGYRGGCRAARRSRSSPLRRWVIHSGIVWARRPL
jgi:hypothetical protein